MPKMYTLIAKQYFGGENPITKGGKIENLTAEQVERFLNSDSADFDNEDDKKSYFEEYQKAKDEKLEKEAKARAILESEKLKDELIMSFKSTLNIEASFLGLFYDEDTISQKIENYLNSITNSEKSLSEKYNEDRNIVDTLNVKDLKSLCKELDIKFTKEDEIREHLKTMEVLEDK